MTDAIRDAAIEAAARALCKLDGKIADTMLESYSPPAIFPLWRQYEPAARAAIAAYERALWRPIAEAPRNKLVLLAWRDWRTAEWENEVNHASTGKRHESGYSSISWHGEATTFRPLPAPPEDAA